MTNYQLAIALRLINNPQGFAQYSYVQNENEERLVCMHECNNGTIIEVEFEHSHWVPNNEETNICHDGYFYNVYLKRHQNDRPKLLGILTDQEADSYMPPRGEKAFYDNAA